MANFEKHSAESALTTFAEQVGSTENKAKWAFVGTVAIALSYIFLFMEGMGSNFIALAWPGMVLCAPFAYDVLAGLLGRSK